MQPSKCLASSALGYSRPRMKVLILKLSKKLFPFIALRFSRT